MSETTRVWVIGAGGLLGSGVRRALAADPNWMLHPAESLPWGDPAAIRERAASTAHDLIAAAAANGQRWAIFWVAGAATTATSEQTIELERAQFVSVIAAIEAASEGTSGGSLFVASSAGGIYGGAVHPPFDERSVPAPASAYGRFKLEVEGIAAEFAARSGIPVLIGRIANLYGPGQHLDKLQGLISQLLLAHFNRKPVQVYVPLETVRNYLFVDDCARLMLSAMSRLVEEAVPHGVVTKVLCSDQNVSISSLLGYVRAIRKAPPRIVLGTGAAAAGQAVDLRLRSVVWPELDARDLTPIVAGIHVTALDILRTLEG
jgi:UDP-glucose 4-epimerase